MGKLPARMTVRLRFILASLLLVLAALALSACGSSHTPLKHEDNTGAGGVDSDYITLDGVRYQVQISRLLNPYTEEDSQYLATFGAAARDLPAGQAWFAVFLLALNPGKQPKPSVSDFTLSDTENNTYTPVPLPADNLYAYRAATIPAGGQIPPVDSAAFYSPTQASLLLFKMPLTAFNNRPWTLTLTNPTDPTDTATVNLDV